MEDYPKNQLEFDERFITEKDCREYLAKIRWPDGYVCCRCKGRKHWITDRGLYYCSDCNYKASVTSGTIFQDTRKSLRIWFIAMWYLVGQKNGVSALGLQKILGFSRYETTWIWLHKLRAAMVRPSRDKLSGLVEVDETYIGGVHSGKRGRGAEGKELVLIAAEDKGTHIGRIRLYHIKDAYAVRIVPAIKEGVELGSTIRTDGWPSYGSLSSDGYPHIVAKPSADLGDNLLPVAHRVASLLKRWMGGTHHGAIGGKHLSYYLDEFTFRFNRRTSKSRGKLFYRLIEQAVSLEPVKNEKIRKPNK